jgi:hypothetical protein
MSAKHQIVVADYHGLSVSFTDDGWFNATAAADRFGKRVDNWLRLDETSEYMQALAEDSNTSKVRDLVRTKRGQGGGTWLHPDLAVQFARWLDVRFAIWCDRQIRGLITGAHPAHDRARLRHEAAASYKVMSQIVQMSREAQGKTSSPHHFSNEARLVNWAASGEFRSIDRDALSGAALDLLARLEERNGVLIGLGHAYEDRKTKLHDFAAEWTAQHAARLAA